MASRIPWYELCNSLIHFPFQYPLVKFWPFWVSVRGDHRGNGAGHLEACAVLAKIMPVFIVKLKQSCCEIGSFQRLLYLLRSFSSNKHMVASVSFVSTGTFNHVFPSLPCIRFCLLNFPGKRGNLVENKGILCLLISPACLMKEI